MAHAMRRYGWTWCSGPLGTRSLQMADAIIAGETQTRFAGNSVAVKTGLNDEWCR